MGSILGKQNDVAEALDRSDELMSRINEFLDKGEWSAEIAEIETRLSRITQRVAGLDGVVNKASVSVAEVTQYLRSLIVVLDEIGKNYQEDDLMVRKTGEGREIVEKAIAQLEQTITDLRVSIPNRFTADDIVNPVTPDRPAKREPDESVISPPRALKRRRFNNRRRGAKSL